MGWGVGSQGVGVHPWHPDRSSRGYSDSNQNPQAWRIAPIPYEVAAIEEAWRSSRTLHWEKASRGLQMLVEVTAACSPGRHGTTWEEAASATVRRGDT